MDWFKFYHNKWLSDPAIVTLSTVDRICFLTILCLASQDEERQGKVTKSNESVVTVLSHLSTPEEQKAAKGVLGRLSETGLIVLESNGDIIVPKFAKRQMVALTNAERQKRYRKKNNSNEEVTQSNDTVTLDKIRGDKIREDSIGKKPTKKKKVQKHKYGEYKNILLTDEEKQKLKDKFGISKAKKMIENMSVSIEMKGYVYKSHYLALLKWERDDKQNKKFGASTPYDSRAADELRARQKRVQELEDKKEHDKNIKSNDRMHELRKQGIALLAKKTMNIN